MDLYLELGVQLLSLNFRAFRGARGVFCPFLFSHLLWLERGKGGGGLVRYLRSRFRFFCRFDLSLAI